MFSLNHLMLLIGQHRQQKIPNVNFGKTQPNCETMVNYTS